MGRQGLASDLAEQMMACPLLPRGLGIGGYTLGIGCLASLLKIGMTLAENIDFRRYEICAENIAFDLASLSWNCWLSCLSSCL
jgi:hypothetical protein